MPKTTGKRETQEMWWASKEYQPWKGVIRKAQHPEYCLAYQSWRNNYIRNLPENHPFKNKIYTKKSKKIIKPKTPQPQQNHDNSIHCYCGGYYIMNNRHFKLRHEDSKRHRFHEEEINKQKREREVVCKFLW